MASLEGETLEALARRFPCVQRKWLTPGVAVSDRRCAHYWARIGHAASRCPEPNGDPTSWSNDAPSGQDWQDDAATVGSFGFKVTTSLWHLSRVSNPRTAEIGSVT
jgi:hypothetical protein